MPKTRYVLWLLNAIADWEPIDALAEAIRGKLRERVVILGDRESPSIAANNHENTKIWRKRAEYSRLGVLQHEGGHEKRTRLDEPKSKLVDEYFVPIPVKCIGSEARGRELLHPEHGKPEMLRAILKAYPEHYGAEAEFPCACYWHGGPTLVADDGGTEAPRPEVRMNSHAGVGYYDILSTWSARTAGEGYDDRHVLIGYSQGGLVARYMCFLDEHVFRRKLIDAAVVVDAPCFGSPLARSDKKNVLQVLTAIQEAAKQFPVAGALRLGTFLASKELGEALAALRGVLEQPLDESNVRQRVVLVIEKMNIAIEAARKERKRSGSASASMVEKTLISATKWASGLLGSMAFAFVDIDPSRNAEPGRVLHCVNQYHLQRIKTAAVVGGNNDLLELIARTGAVQGVLAKLLFGGPLRRAGGLYRSAFDEPPIPAEPDELRDYLDETQGNYRKDFVPDHVNPTGAKIKSRAHDFVIPSAYQLLPAPKHGNVLNLDADHLSGAQLTDLFPNALDRVVSVLEEMYDGVSVPATADG